MFGGVSHAAFGQLKGRGLPHKTRAYLSQLYLDTKKENLKFDLINYH